jgi:hypothetical protein
MGMAHVIALDRLGNLIDPHVVIPGNLLVEKEQHVVHRNATGIMNGGGTVVGTLKGDLCVDNESTSKEGKKKQQFFHDRMVWDSTIQLFKTYNFSKPQKRNSNELLLHKACSKHRFLAQHLNEINTLGKTITIHLAVPGDSNHLLHKPSERVLDFQ